MEQPDRQVRHWLSVACGIVVMSCGVASKSGSEGDDASSIGASGSSSSSGADPGNDADTSTGPEASSAGALASGTESSSSGGSTTDTSGVEIPCEERLEQELCEDVGIDVPGEASQCVWEELLVIDSGAACDTGTTHARCLGMPPGGPGGCLSAPEWCGPLTVIYRLDGTSVELLPGDYCGVIPYGFDDCSWYDRMNLGDDDPAECACGRS